MLRIGIVDFDTSHVVAFTQRINHIDVPPADRAFGGRVVAGCPGDSRMMPERIGPYAEQLRAYGVTLVKRPADLIGKIDAVMVESQQGARHLERARPFLEAGIPTFVDKPFAATVADADAMIALAQRHAAPLMSCSSLRYDPQVRKALDLRRTLGPVLSADVWTTATLHPGNPGLLHYGIHGVEMLYALMGAGCTHVRCDSTLACDVVTGAWPSGRLGTVRGIRQGQGGFGLAVHYERGHFAACVEGSAFYTEMLKAVLGMFETRREPIALHESREIIAFIVAARKSSSARGARQTL
ncbi:MAG: Gfo/Idh/MocA family oxidoreductase [Armatimonadetes bacterium]|nr:Gfo/Idh/MocA family oxidoreductase [Armatimonadota bacterium]